MEKQRFVGYRVLEFSGVIKETLQEVADRLKPYQQEILDRWIKRQVEAWNPPTISPQQLRNIFGVILDNMLCQMSAGKLEKCVEDMARAGVTLAENDFPYEALIISFHFLEDSYMPFLLEPQPPKILDLLTQLDAFLHAALAAIASSYFQAYRRQLLERAEVGRIIQEGLLPTIPEQASDLGVGHVYLSAGERAQVGGDLISILQVGPSVAFIIGDLSGHGLDAATDSAKVRFLFNGFMHDRWNILQAVSKLNKVLRAELRPGNFATALSGTYDGNGTIKLVGAGHPPPLICDGTCSLLEPAGLPLGTDYTFEFSETAARLNPGGIFVAYTDGIVEARREGRMFGDGKVMEIVKRAQNLAPQMIADQLRDEVLRYAGGSLRDDAAVLVFKRH